MKIDNKGRDIFFGLVALATLIVAIVGATLAYFSVMASSNEGAINATAATVSITYKDGQQVTTQADKLIPIDFDKLQGIYERNIKGLEPKEIEELSSNNLCVDDSAAEYQVCSVYRFTVKSDNSREVTARLNSEENGFTYLNYAIYDITNGKWVDLTVNGVQNLSLNKCTNTNNEGDNPVTDDDCATTDEYGQKQYLSNSIFGLTEEDEYASTLLAAGVEQTYDVILFIKNAPFNQNIDQGKNFRGHIVVDVLDGGLAGDRIEGFYDENK